MPAIPVADLNNLRTTPQQSTLYLVIQQPSRYDSTNDIYTVGDFVWYGTVKTAPATDPITSLAVTAHGSSPGATILDGMTVMISSSTYGKWERGIVRAHGDQTILGAGNDDTLYIAVSSDLSAVQVGDYIAVLDEFRFWNRYPKVTESGGTLSWYKDYGYFLDSIGEAGGDIGLTWDQLGAADANRRQACMPPIPIMSSHVVQFIDPDVGSVDIDFDWTDSYAVATGGTVNAWVSEGETDHVGGTWNSAVQNPAAQTYSAISGLRGFRVTLEVGTDITDPIVEYRRGVRYVFTLRRPEDVQDSDPSDAAPITDFEVTSISGSFDSGGWRTSIRVYNSQADEYSIVQGSLVILFADDYYGSTHESIGPDDTNLVDRENIVMVGYIADNSVREDSETGDTTFEIISISELMKNRENYPVPIENDDGADEWYKAPGLTVDRASHHYLRWHTNLSLVADLYQTGDTREVAAMDFLAGDAYSTIDQFIQDRLFARLLCDRFGRFSMEIDQQMETAGGATTLFNLADTDWIGEVSLQEITERPTSVADAGGVYYNAGLIIPYLSHAPGEVSGYEGSPEQRMSLALASQAQLNTLSGRLYAYLNNQYPGLTIPMLGNWRVFDIWPQEYISVSLALKRHTFSSDLFIPREVSFEYDAREGTLMTVVNAEAETDGPDGVTVVIPETLPAIPTTGTTSPPSTPVTGEDTGRRIIGSDQGVFVTDDIEATNPRWYKVDAGLSSGDEQCSLLRKDPWHWWTTTNEKTMFGIFGANGGTTCPWLYKMENFPYGTWDLVYTADGSSPRICDLKGSYEIEDKLYLIRFVSTSSPRGDIYVHRSTDDGDNWSQLAQLVDVGVENPWYQAANALGIAQHSNARIQHVGGGFPLGTGAWTADEWSTINYDGDYPSTSFEMYVPYISASWGDSYLVSSASQNLHVSENYGMDWTSIPEPTGDFYVATIPFEGAVGYFTMLNDGGHIYITVDGGTTWTLWASTGLPGAGWGRIPLVLFQPNGLPESVLLAYHTTIGIYLTRPGVTANKTGNLLSLAPSLSVVTSILADTVGRA